MAQATITDVARRANVSITTVSHVLNRRPGARVKAQTRERVLEAASALGYAANALARGLVWHRAQHLGIVVANRQKTQAVAFGEILAGVQEAAMEAGYFPMLCPLGEEELAGPAGHGPQRLEEMLRSRRVDGILFNKEEIFNAIVERLVEEAFPVVVINGKVPRCSRPVHAVTIDNRGGAQMAVEHLLGLGHRRIGFIARRPLNVETGYRSYVEREKLDGYAAALQAAGIALDPRWVREGSDADRAPNEAAIEALLQLSPAPTALMTTDDAIAAFTLSILHRRGLRVPEDVSVMGYGNLTMGRMVEPPLSTVETALHQMGRLGTQRLIDLIEQRPVEAPHVSLAPHLVLRDSCAPPL